MNSPYSSSRTQTRALRGHQNTPISIASTSIALDHKREKSMDVNEIDAKFVDEIFDSKKKISVAIQP